jgi:rod shape-determining protein MreD
MKPVSNTAQMALGFLVVFLLQVGLASNLAVFGAVAEITLCFAIANGFRVSADSAVICGFLLGALVDLYAGSPLGTRAMSYSLVAWSSASIMSRGMVDTIPARLITMVVLIFCGEMITALLISVVSRDSFIAHHLLTLVIPGGLYSSLVALFFIPMISLSAGRFGSGTGSGKQLLKETLPPR